MSQSNEWSIDFIEPIYSDDPKELVKKLHYSNLRPMWNEDIIEHERNLSYEIRARHAKYRNEIGNMLMNGD